MAENNNKQLVMHIIYDLSLAGAQTVVMDYLRQMNNDPDYEVMLLVRDSDKGSIYDSEVKAMHYPVVYCNYKETDIKIPGIKKIINWVYCQKLILHQLRVYRPDIVHTHVSNILPFALLPILLCGVKKRFHTLHSDPYAVGKQGSFWTKEALRLFKFDPICLNEVQAQKAVQKYGIKHYDIVRNGLNLDRYIIGESQSDIRKELGIESDAFVIGYIGSLYSLKNVNFLIEVFDIYKKKHPKARLLIVGDGVDRQKLEAQVDHLGIRSSVVFTGRRGDVERMYKAMDVFMLASYFESNSIVTVEAQAAGKRCVVAKSVPESVVVTTLVNRIGLDEPIEKWVDAIDDQFPHDTPVGSLDMFSISSTIKELKAVYKEPR